MTYSGGDDDDDDVCVGSLLPLLLFTSFLSIFGVHVMSCAGLLIMMLWRWKAARKKIHKKQRRTRECCVLPHCCTFFYISTASNLLIYIFFSCGGWFREASWHYDGGDNDAIVVHSTSKKSKTRWQKSRIFVVGGVDRKGKLISVWLSAFWSAFSVSSVRWESLSSVCHHRRWLWKVLSRLFYFIIIIRRPDYLPLSSAVLCDGRNLSYYSYALLAHSPPHTHPSCK